MRTPNNKRQQADEPAVRGDLPSAITDKDGFGSASDRRLSELARVLEAASAHGNSLVSPFLICSKKGRALYCSDAFSKMTGIWASQIAQKNLDGFIHNHDRVAMAQLLDTAANGKPGQLNQLRLASYRPDSAVGSFLWMKICAGLDESGEFLVVGFVDISERKQAENQLIHARDCAEAANIAKSRALATASHEIRTPLNAILGFSHLLCHAGDNQAKMAEEYPGLIHDAASHLMAVLNTILDVSKIESGQITINPVSVDPGKAITTVITMMNGQARPRDISLQFFPNTPLPDIVVDERALQQILINLVSNAIKFSQNKDTVTIAAERRARNVVIEVRDQGIGIARDDLNRLGQPFFQARQHGFSPDQRHETGTGQGTGLGLSIVKNLVELHQGRLDFSSIVNSGTRAIVTLPIQGPGARAACDTSEPVMLFADQDETRLDDDKNKCIGGLLADVG